MGVPEGDPCVQSITAQNTKRHLRNWQVPFLYNSLRHGSRRTSSLNLYLHDHEEVAEYISTNACRPWQRRAAVVVYPDGRLGLVRTPEDELTKVVGQPNCIGVYGPGSRIENIEDDILYWLRGPDNHLRKF